MWLQIRQWNFIPPTGPDQVVIEVEQHVAAIFPLLCFIFSASIFFATASWLSSIFDAGFPPYASYLLRIRNKTIYYSGVTIKYFLVVYQSQPF